MRFLDRQRERMSDVYHEYPRPFWTLVGVTFIDRLGGALLFPFFALYISNKFEVGMTEVGVLFALFSVSSFVGVLIGGALTDRLGRKGMVIFSLISTSISSVIMGLVNSLTAFYILALVVGIFTDAGGPANQAMVADLLPEKQRAEGFGIIRVVFNLSVTIGPAIGGFLATRSYLSLFITDAIISLISAVIIWRAMPETRPQPEEGAVHESMLTTFRGYGTVLRDSVFVAFILAGILSGFTYMNLNTTLGVYLRDSHGIPESGYGFILSLNAAMVVLFQFWITRRIKKFPPMMVMAIGTFLYALGFAMYGFVGTYALFLLAMVVITIGEMLIAPVAQAIIARFAPADMRGRYMAIAGFSFGIPYAVGPLVAGLILDNTRAEFLWWAAGIVGLFSVMMYLRLHRELGIEPLSAGVGDTD
ncbi:MAG: MFS transporter [Anaerolineales bacterium]|nr:MAG: MFS transporter [Anaerolineales bacterium]